MQLRILHCSQLRDRPLLCLQKYLFKLKNFFQFNDSSGASNLAVCLKIKSSKIKLYFYLSSFDENFTFV